jgi:protein TonB
MKRLVLYLIFILLAAPVGLAEPVGPPRPDDIIAAPRPEYPVEARRRNLQGSGMFILRVRPDGTVARVEVQDSTGAPLLDRTAIAAYSKWRFKPGRVKAVRVPVHFTMAPYPYIPQYHPPRKE